MFEKIKSKNSIPERKSNREGNFYRENHARPGMNRRIQDLREESITTPATLSIERALITTRFYKENNGKFSIPMMRALNFLEICEKKTIYLGKDELIVG